MADENKNWINWRYYNPNKKIIPIQFNEGTHQVQCEYNGIYLTLVASHNRTNSITTTGNILNSNIGSNGSSYAIIYCEIGDTITANSATTTTVLNPVIGTFFIQGFTAVGSNVEYYSGNGNPFYKTVTIAGGGTNLLFGAATCNSANSVAKLNITASSEEETYSYIHANGAKLGIVLTNTHNASMYVYGSDYTAVQIGCCTLV